MHTDLSRFMSYVEIKGECWIWKGATDIKGYGIFFFKKKTCFAHRISLILHNKITKFTPGLVVRHSCKSKSCVNPNHLSEGTQSENAQDKRRDGTDMSGDKCHFSKLNWKSVSEIRKKYLQNITQHTLSKEYDVSVSCIHSIVNNKSWIEFPTDLQIQESLRS